MLSDELTTTTTTTTKSEQNRRVSTPVPSQTEIVFPQKNHTRFDDNNMPTKNGGSKTTTSVKTVEEQV